MIAVRSAVGLEPSTEPGLLSGALTTLEHNPYDSIEGEDLAEKEREGTRLSEAAQEESDIRWLMGHARGRSVANRLLKQAKVHINPFNANAMQMSNQCGHQRMGTELLKVINRVAMKEKHTMELDHGAIDD